MKIRLLFLLTLWLPILANAQIQCGGIALPEYLDFESEVPWTYFLSIDTVSNPDNIWQVGHPQKATINQAYSEPNVIITDTLSPYPINDTSSFIIKHADQWGFSLYHTAELACWYYVDTDSLHDLGLIEFSPDNDTTWIDITDTTYDPYIYWYEPKPILTGHSNGWKYLHCSLAKLGQYFTIDFGDTILLRFTFISDSIPDTLGGLAFDSFAFCDGAEGIEEKESTRISSKAFPNPTGDKVIIKFENLEFSPFELVIYDSSAKRVLEQGDVRTGLVTIDTRAWGEGVYYFLLESPANKEWTGGKFVVTRE